ncbi:MAG: GNAT family N-acetyltransferase [Eubacteriales bacterium]|nr:GNAT family N-acetyltransferase [Eubacteriales bacterium]
MNGITLRRIDQTNYLDCFRLKLAEGQESYVSHPIRSLAQAYVYYQQCTPFGIYWDTQMIGYVMVIYDDDEETYNIWHMMIDEAYQKQGYGKAALQCALAYIAKKPFGPSNKLLLTCNPDNKAAYGLYSSLGFTPTGRTDEEEVELGMCLAE